MARKDGTLITGRSSHQVYVIEDGKLRYVPDSWTMKDRQLSPAEIVVVGDDELETIPLGEPIPTSIPAPKLPDGTYVESDTGVFLVQGDQLLRVLDPRQLTLEDGFDAANVPFLPDSILRGAISGITPNV